MKHSEQHSPKLPSTDGFPETLRRLRPILVAVVAIGLATGATFVALVWLDSSMRFLSPSVIRLGVAEPPVLPLRAAPAQRAGEV